MTNDPTSDQTPDEAAALRDETLSVDIDGHAHDDDRALLAAHDGDEAWSTRRDEFKGVRGALTMLAASTDITPELPEGETDNFYADLAQTHGKVKTPSKVGATFQYLGIAAALLLIVGVGFSVVRNDSNQSQNTAANARSGDITNSFNNAEAARDAARTASENLSDTGAAPSAVAGAAEQDLSKATALAEQPPITAGAQDYPTLDKFFEAGFTSDDDFKLALKSLREAGYLNDFKPGFVNPAVNTCRASSSSLDWSGRTRIANTEIEIYLNSFSGGEGTISQVGTLLVYNYTYPNCTFRYAFP